MIQFLRKIIGKYYLYFMGPLGAFFTRLGIHPNIITMTGLVLSIGAALLYGEGLFFWAAWVVLLAGMCDTLDGQVARETNRKSDYGAFFDSTLDRYGDTFLFIGLAYYFAGGRILSWGSGNTLPDETSPVTVVIIILAITGSFVVSYTRARAEGLGIECREGIMQRPERMTLLIIGSLLGSLPVVGAILMKLTLLIFAVSTNVTAINRILFIRRRLLHDRQGPI